MYNILIFFVLSWFYYAYHNRFQYVYVQLLEVYVQLLEVRISVV